MACYERFHSRFFLFVRSQSSPWSLFFHVCHHHTHHTCDPCCHSTHLSSCPRLTSYSHTGLSVCLCSSCPSRWSSLLYPCSKSLYMSLCWTTSRCTFRHLSHGFSLVTFFCLLAVCQGLFLCRDPYLFLFLCHDLYLYLCHDLCLYHGLWL